MSAESELIQAAMENRRLVVGLLEELESLRRDNALLLAIRDAAMMDCIRGVKQVCGCGLCHELDAYDNREK